MTAHHDTTTTDPFSLQGADFMRVALGELYAWEAKVTGRRLIVPKPDEEVWEGTEIDPRRTVL